MALLLLVLACKTLAGSWEGYWQREGEDTENGIRLELQDAGDDALTGTGSWDAAEDCDANGKVNGGAVSISLCGDGEGSVLLHGMVDWEAYTIDGDISVIDAEGNAEEVGPAYLERLEDTGGGGVWMATTMSGG